MPDSVTPDLVLALNMVATCDINVTYVRSEEVCPCCGEKLTFRNIVVVIRIIWIMCKLKNIGVIVVEKLFILILAVLHYLIISFSFNIMHWYAKLNEIMAVPFEKASELFEALFNVYISPSTLYNHYDIFSNEYIQSQEDLLEEVEKKQLKDKGVYTHDEHFPHQKWYWNG